MKIKTFPLQFTEEYLDQIREKAASQNVSMKEFMLSAIDEKLKKEN